MSAPYWGALPQPKGIQSRRVSADYTNEFSPNDQRRSLDVQPQRKANRASIQTTYTEAPTDTTFSPNSPTSAAEYQGLAPRPASYRGFGFQEQTYEGYDRQDRRSNRIPDDFGAASPAPSATDTIIRGPPTNYRDPYANESQRDVPLLFGDNVPTRTDSIASPNQLQRSATSATTGQGERRKNMTKEEKRARVEAAEQRARARAAKRAAAETGESRPQTLDYQSSPSAPSQRQQQPPAAIEPISPVPQRITPQRDAVPPKDSGTQPISPPRRIAEDQYYRQNQDPAPRQPRQLPQPPVREERQPRQLPQPPVREDPQPRQLPQPPIRDEQRRVYPQEAPRSDDQRRYFSQESPQRPRASMDQRQFVPETDVPQRNLSFRERDIWHEAKPLDADVNQPTKESSGFSLTRSGSNKLKKDPPADVWHRIRVEAERRLPPGSQPGEAQYKDAAQSPRAAAGTAPLPQERNREPAPLPLAANNGPNARPETKRHSQSATEAEIQAMQRRATEPIYAREERGLNADYAPAAAIGRIIYEASQKARGRFPQPNPAAKSLEDQTDHDLIEDTQKPQEPQESQIPHMPQEQRAMRMPREPQTQHIPREPQMQHMPQEQRAMRMPQEP
ncbi:hypothetical protein CI102_11193, partial [Trichoderma harzianum]